VTLPKDINFALCGSFVDRINRRLPNYRRLSGCLVERQVNQTLVLDQIDAGTPAISADDFAIWVEPAGDNLITYNIDLTQSVWEKGGNVTVKADFAPAPTAIYTADAIIWLFGSGNTQVLGRNFSLAQGSSHYLRLILQCPVGSRFGRNDVIRFSGAVSGTPGYALSVLNDYQGQYRFVDIPFTTSGVASVSSIPTLPLSISAVTASTITIPLSGRLANDLTGATLVFSNAPTTIYEVASNTATSGGNIIITATVSTLVTDGVTTSSTVTLGQPTTKTVRVELYVESTASLIWGGGNLEKTNFPTSPIYQTNTRTGRAATEVVWQPRDNVIANATSFGLFADLKVWRGDGNLFDFGNWKLAIVNGQLTATVGAVTITDPDQLPVACKFYVQTSGENATTSIYVNGTLKAKASTPSFRGSTSSPVTLNSNGVRAYRSVWTTALTQSDGQPTVGSVATGDVAFAFNNEVIGQDLIAAQDAVFVLQSVTVPASSQVFARFPFVPIDTQTISAISSNTLSVTSALSFVTGKAYIQSNVNGTVTTVTEVVVTGINTTASPNTITVASATGVSVGNTISQPVSETLIFPTNYTASTVETITGISSGSLGKAENGVIYSNSTTQAQVVTPKITVAL
jgi:hypothetical protein